VPTQAALRTAWWPELGPPRPRTAFAPGGIELVQWALRVVGLVLVGLLVLVTSDLGATGWVFLLAVAAMPAWTQPYNARLAFIGRLAEVFVTTLGASSLAVAHPGTTASALLPYLAIPLVVTRTSRPTSTSPTSRNAHCTSSIPPGANAVRGRGGPSSGHHAVRKEACLGTDTADPATPSLRGSPAPGVGSVVDRGDLVGVLLGNHGALHLQ
jgi:hypothetical protein